MTTTYPQFTKHDYNKFNQRFQSLGYLAICAPRRAGKTTFLQSIITSNPYKQFLVLCVNYEMQHYFRKNIFTNNITCKTYSKNVSQLSLGFSYVIGDEVYIPRLLGVTVACAFSVYSGGNTNNVLVANNPDIICWEPEKFHDSKEFVWKNI